MKSYDYTDIDQTAAALRELSDYLGANSELLQFACANILGWDEKKISKHLTDSIVVEIGAINNIFATSVAGVSNLLQGTKLDQFRERMLDKRPDANFINDFVKYFDCNNIGQIISGLANLQYELHTGKEIKKLKVKYEKCLIESNERELHQKEQIKATFKQADQVYNILDRIKQKLMGMQQGLDVAIPGTAANELIEMLHEVKNELEQPRKGRGQS